MRVIVAIFFLPILAIAQGTQPGLSSSQFSEYLTAYSHTEKPSSFSRDDIEHFMTKLSVKKGTFKSEKIFLGYVFTKTHQRFLKEFQEYATFQQTLTKGRYNCLTGTALYALILEHLHLRYQIIETNHHIFLLAETNDGKILFEATDPLNGFVSNDPEIEKRIETYKKTNLPQNGTDKMYYRFNVELFNTIDLEELQGLLHYNQAVEAYNRKDLSSSINHLEKAARSYYSPRIEEFSKILLLTVFESKLDRSSKENYLRKIQALRNNRAQLVASASAKSY